MLLASLQSLKENSLLTQDEINGVISFCVVGFISKWPIQRIIDDIKLNFGIDISFIHNDNFGEIPKISASKRK